MDQRIELGNAPVVTIAIAALRTALESEFRGVGLSGEEAACVVDALVEAELNGVPTHGVLRAGRYLATYRSGTFNNRPDIREVVRAGGIAVIDADRALGFLPTRRAVDLSIELASEHGVSAVGIRNVAEFGRAAHYTVAAAARGYVSIACQNTPPLLASPGGKVATHGNNPLAFACPGDDAPVFDAAFSPRAAGELRRRATLGLEVPVEWGYVDADGNPITDPALAFSSVMPTVGGGKGFGLAVLVDLLAGILPGAASGADVRMGEPEVGVMVITLDPRAFGTSDDVVAKMSASASLVRSTGGHWPGDRGRALRRAALERGTIEVPETIYAGLLDVAGSLDPDPLVKEAG